MNNSSKHAFSYSGLIADKNNSKFTQPRYSYNITVDVLQGYAGNIYRRNFLLI